MTNDRFGLYNPARGAIGSPPTLTPIGIGQSRVVFQALDQSVSNSVSAVQITNLTFEIEANKNYRIRAWVPFALAGTASGYKFSISAPASPTNIALRDKVTDGDTPAPISDAYKNSYSGSAGALAVIGDHFWEVDGVIENGANGGNLFLRFAQQTSDADAITVKRGAYLEVTRIS